MSTHDCPGGCGRPVPQHHFACRPDWYRLPAELQLAIKANYRRDPAAHMQAMADSIAWYADNPRGGER